ncbi:MAG: DUF4097 family beta strand repeat-containing protein [Candidatus Cloacimonadaceae bacterium]|nr:DUF4097 family beta strand repeat-containing protein [Candidatus Cloacimonadaceae bacterium]MDP3115052.1 DUF4097 family beta strand repeat-containing protein [Candidatus Cloacimonadaceae bacterium]
MKAMKLRHVFNYVGIEKVMIRNYLAPLSILPSETDKVELTGDLYLVDPAEDFDFEEYVSASFNETELKIELDELSELEQGFFSLGKSSISLMIPKGVKLSVETDNLPLSVQNLDVDLEISNENGPVMINNCHGKKKIESENGPVKLHNCEGDLDIELENGPLSAEAMSGDQIIIKSENGPVKLRAACFKAVEIENENGVIYYETLPVEGGNFRFENENGIVHLVLPEDFDFELNAKTALGTLKSKIDIQITRDDDSFHMIRGTGDTKIEIITENGMIKLSSDGHMNLSFLMMKLAQLKDGINITMSDQDKEKVMKLMENISAYVEKTVKSIDEEKIQSTIIDAIGKLKETVSGFDVYETKDKVVSNVDKISKEIGESFQEIIKVFKEKVASEFKKERLQEHFHGEKDMFKNYFKKVFDSPLIKPYLGGDLSDKEKDLVNERSRIKILEMLEAGKITSEEAERLLKAISKE